MKTPALLDVFCGVGGWSKAFHRRGWRCVGVDIAALGYPFEFVQSDALALTPEFIESFDGVVLSPPCEEFARAWLPMAKSGMRPDLRAEIPDQLSDWIAQCFTRHYEENQLIAA